MEPVITLYHLYMRSKSNSATVCSPPISDQSAFINPFSLCTRNISSDHASSKEMCDQ